MHVCSPFQAFHEPLHNKYYVVIYSGFIELCPWAYETIYGWWPETDLYLPLLSTLGWYTVTVYTIAVSLLESPLAHESLLGSLLNSLLDSLHERATCEKASHERATCKRATLVRAIVWRATVE